MKHWSKILAVRFDTRSKTQLKRHIFNTQSGNENVKNKACITTLS